MKKVLPGILLALIIASPLCAKTHSSKTFLMPKSNNPELGMEYTTWHKQIKLQDEDKFGGTVQAIPFYQESDNKEDLGKYFGIFNKFSNHIIEDFIMVDDNVGTQLYTNDIIHFYAWSDDDFEAANLLEKITFRPYQTSYGVRLHYHQKLDKLLDGLYLKIDAPLVCVKTSMGYTSSSQAGQKLFANGDYTNTTNGLYIDPDSTTGAEKTLEDYLTGDLENTATHAKQVPLTHYKIHNGQSETGIADIKVTLGYNILNEQDKHVGFYASLLIPTGTTPEGIYRFEPIVGNGNHWAVGGGIDAAFELWKEDTKSLEVGFIVDVQYLFKGTEKRTLDFKYADTTDFSYTNQRATWGPYLLGGKSGDTFATPLANFLTQDVDVSPGVQVNGMVNATFNWGDWTIDLGYEVYYKEQEIVAVQAWDDGTYGTADWNWDTTKAFITGTTSVYETIYRGANANAYTSAYDLTKITIDQSCLLTADAETPSYLTHKVFGGVGYIFNKWDYPLMLGLGGNYTFATGNSALEGWAAYGKVGIAF
jgi:hypothetical protein